MLSGLPESNRMTGDNMLLHILFLIEQLLFRFHLSGMSFTVIRYFIPGVVAKKNALISSGEYWPCRAHQRMVSAKSFTI